MSFTDAASGNLATLAEKVGKLITGRHVRGQPKETLAVVEATTGGLVNAELLAIPGASAYYIGGALTYSGESSQALLPEAVRQALGAATKAQIPGRVYESEANYVKSKEIFCEAVGKGMRDHFSAQWCSIETGASGPTFLPHDCK